MAKKLLILLFASLLLGGCTRLDTVLSSSDTYQIKARVNDIPFEECSLVGSNDQIRPYFGSSVADDPDVTGLVVFLENSRKQILGEKLVYSLNSGIKNEAADEKTSAALRNLKYDSETPFVAAAKETIIPVKRLDRELPGFFLPKNLAMGDYTLVFRVLTNTENIQQTKKTFYYLGNARFVFKDIQIHLPSLVTGSQLIPPDTTLMLKANLDFDPRLNPYLVWYNGKKIIGEGSVTENAGILLWKTPEENGFYLLRAEVFPFQASRQKIAGTSIDVSLPVSSKAVKAPLFSGDNPDLLRWYQFDGNLKDAKFPYSANAALAPDAKQPPRWIPASHSYGLCSGSGEAYLLPAISFVRPGEEEGIAGRIVFRFMPCGEGGLLSAAFAFESPDLSEPLTLKIGLKEEAITMGIEGPNIAPLEVSKKLPDNALITAALEFGMYDNRFGLRLIPDYQVQQTDGEANAADSGFLDVGTVARLSGECRITLGTPANTAPADSGEALTSVAVWNEMALLHITQFLPETKLEDEE